MIGSGLGVLLLMCPGVGVALRGDGVQRLALVHHGPGLPGRVEVGVVL